MLRKLPTLMYESMSKFIYIYMYVYLLVYTYVCRSCLFMKVMLYLFMSCCCIYYLSVYCFLYALIMEEIKYLISWFCHVVALIFFKLNSSTPYRLAVLLCICKHPRCRFYSQETANQIHCNVTYPKLTMA